MKRLSVDAVVLYASGLMVEQNVLRPEYLHGLVVEAVAALRGVLTHAGEVEAAAGLRRIYRNPRRWKCVDDVPLMGIILSMKRGLRNVSKESFYR